MPPQALSAAQPLWCVLGREPLLSAAEIFALLPPSHCAYAAPFVFCSCAHDPAALMARLGGTVKIARELASDVPEEELIRVICRALQAVGARPDFGVSFYDSGSAAADASFVKKIAFAVKRALQAEDKNPRVVLGDGPILSSVLVHTQKLLERGGEFIIRRVGERFAVAQTAAVQPFLDWSERDFGRPGRDDTSGMLPPKLARIMINCAGSETQRILLDPFCGSGTVLTEALLLGYKHIIGSDMSDRAVEDSKQNISWLSQKNTRELSGAQAQVLQADARDLGKKISHKSVACIITEPYLGPPLRGNEQPADLQRNAHELAALYIQSFSTFNKIAVPGATVVIVLPRFTVRNKTYRTAEVVVPKIKKLGFTAEALLPITLSSDPFVLYRRPDQFVGREIWKFKFTA